MQMKNCRRGCSRIGVHGVTRCKMPTGNSMKLSNDEVKRRSPAPLNYRIIAIPEVG